MYFPLSSVDFDQHATDRNIIDRSRLIGPVGDAGMVDIRHRTTGEPPASLMNPGTVVKITGVRVAVPGAELHAAAVPTRIQHRITGVSAVSGHRQQVLTDLSKYDSYSNNNMSVI